MELLREYLDLCEYLRRLRARKILRNYLSIAPHPSQAQYFAEVEDHQNLKQIGKGQCGTICAQGSGVLKIPNSNAKLEQLRNDFEKHGAVQRAFQQLSVSAESRPNIRIPLLGKWVDCSAGAHRRRSEWENLLATDLRATDGFESSRIRALPATVRKSLFDCFAPRKYKTKDDSSWETGEQQDCLVRLYLGRRGIRGPHSRFSLRNFDLMVNEMEWLKLDVAKYAIVMAKTLAVLHWKVGMDGDDIEFVLGQAPMPTLPDVAETSEDTDDNSQHYSQSLGYVSIWLLDFNQCQYLPPINEESRILKQIAEAFIHNDPYYPRPAQRNKNDQQLWRVW
jgi:hypothetical protein